MVKKKDEKRSTFPYPLSQVRDDRDISEFQTFTAFSGGLKMNHSIEFGRNSWAGAQWGNTSLGSSGFSTAARSTPPSLFASNQGEFVTGIFGADLQRSDQSYFFPIPSVWVI